MTYWSDIWGPQLGNYSRRRFRPSESPCDLSFSNLTGAWRNEGMIPINLLEKSLCKSNIKRDCYGDRPITSLLMALENYDAANKRGVRADP